MAQVWEYIKIALMNIRSNKGRSFLTMLGIIIGISSVIMIVSVGNGVQNGVGSQLNNIAGGQIYVYAYGNNDEGISLEFTDADIEAIMEKVDHVKAVTPQWNFSGTATGRKGSFSAIGKFGNSGMEYSANTSIIRGRYFTDSDYYAARRVCVIGEKDARTLFGTTDVVGMTVDFNLYGTTQEFIIVGIREDDSALEGMGITISTGETMVSLEMPLTVISEVYGFYVSNSDLLVISEGAEYATQVAVDTVKLLENRHDVRGKEVISVENFNDYVSQFNEILGYITIFVSFVAAISLLVGGIGVMNIMLVSVTERTREIGIRKALGARTGSILLQFLSESAIITLLGGVIGIVLGILGAAGICSLIGFRVSVDPIVVLSASLFSSAVGIFFGIYPARKAARLSPIEALRRE